MNSRQKAIIHDNLNSFIYNFGKVRIENNPPDKGFYVYFPANSESYIQYCYNIDYLNGWLYGAVQAARRGIRLQITINLWTLSLHGKKICRSE